MAEERKIRSIASEFQTREEENEKYIEGYFAVFDSNYDLWEGASETIAQGAFSKSISNDVRALINHDTTLVLGRSKAGTLELKEDSHGLWGKVRINPDDVDAMNAYARVKRGDVDQCSFGFSINAEEFRDDGNGHCTWVLTDIELYEVSVCTFPAYEATAISAREKSLEEIEKRKAELEAEKLENWKAEMRKKLSKGE